MQEDPQFDITPIYSRGIGADEMLVHYRCLDCGATGDALLPSDGPAEDSLRDLAACGVPLCDCEKED